MCKYEDLIDRLNIVSDAENKKIVKAIVHSLINNEQARIIKQDIDINYALFEQLYNILNELKDFFDYRYSTKVDLTKFLNYVLTKEVLNIHAIFCPGYTKDGYKNYIGNNNSSRLIILKDLKTRLIEMSIPTNINIELADIFLENTDSSKNKNWKEELNIHRAEFIRVSSQYFEKKNIIKLSDIFTGLDYEKGFINTEICSGKTYDSFYKNNMEFYKKMNWNANEIANRNDKLYTIYTIISEYISQKPNGIYVPMETMYSRSKVMTKNDTCTMYLNK